MHDDEAVDGGLQVYDRMKDPMLEAPARQLGEKSFDSIQPGA